jgi:hypothetical protein
LAALIIIGSIQWQEYMTSLGRRGLIERIFSLGIMILLAHDLLQHSRIWRVTNMYSLFPSTPVDIQSRVINHPDPIYFSALVIGAAGTLITFFVLLFLSLRELKRNKLDR